MIVMSALLAAGSASAATVRGSCRASYYPVLTTDLLQTAVSSTIDKLTINTAENNANSHGTLATLTDGTFGGVGAHGGLCIAGGSLTYMLDTTVNKRDLIGDLADACKKRGLGLVLCVHPNDRDDLNPAEQQILIDAGWAESILTKDAIWIDKEGDLADTGRRGTDQKWNKMYFRIIEELGTRYGTRMAATEGQENGGFVMAAGPWSNNDCPPGTVDLMKDMIWLALAPILAQ